MNETQASVTVEKEGYTEESMMFTYSEQEMEENKINRENAERVFSPEFIPDYVSLEKALSLKWYETRIYGFIRFYMYNAKAGGRFYFTDKQLAEIANISERSVSRAISRLREKGLISTSHKMKAGGGSLRFITAVHRGEPGSSSLVSRDRPVGEEIDNKINKNKIKEIESISSEPAAPAARTLSFKGNRFPDGSTQDKRFTEFWALYPKKLKKKEAREAFKKIIKTSEMYALLRVGLEKWVKEWDTWEDTERRYIPYPSTWLNGERWEDEIETKKKEVVHYLNEIKR